MSIFNIVLFFLPKNFEISQNCYTFAPQFHKNFAKLRKFCNTKQQKDGRIFNESTTRVLGIIPHQVHDRAELDVWPMAKSVRKPYAA